MDMDSVTLWLEFTNNEERVERRIIRDNSNIMEINHKSFVQNFRLSKEAFMYVLNSIREELSVPLRSTAVPMMLKLGVTLKFLGQGGYQHQIGQDFRLGLAQQTASSCIAEVCSAIEKLLCPRHINFKMTEEERKKCKKMFFDKSGIPSVIGVVDGTHIQMIRPSTNEHLFFNRKCKHSINAMVICDHAMCIRAVNGRYGGAAHDSHVWRLSHEREFLKQNFENGDKSSWIIGDSGYPLEPWIVTPFRNAAENSPESYFNEQFSKARSLIERVFGVLKGRFRCILAARELHYGPEKVVKILNTCCALHNNCLKYNVELPVEIPSNTEDDLLSYNLIQQDTLDNVNLANIAKAVREQIKNNLLPQ